MKRKITLNLDQLKKMFSPPVFESDDMKTRQANLINGLLQGFLLVTLCFGVLGSLVVYKRFTIQTVIMLLLTVALVGVYRLLKKGYVQFAGTTLIVLLWSLFTVAIVLLGGVHSPAFAGYIVVALIAGLLQGPRQTLVLVVMSILSGVGTIIGEMNGLLVYPIPHPLAGVLMAYAFLLMMTAVIINLDVSSRRQAEQALRESEQRFRGVLEQSQDGIAVNDEKGILITWNATMEKISGLPVADVLGRPIWDVQYQMLAPEDQFEERRKGLQIGLQSFLETGTSPWANQLLEREYMRPDGKKLYVQGITFPIQTERGFMLGSITRDISSQKQAEQALRKSEENYRTLFDEASDAILVLDVQSNILDVNKRTSELLGISHDELLQRNALEFLHEDDVKNKDHEATLAPLMAGKTIQSDYRLQREDGSYVPTELSTKMLDENRFLNIARDLTERLAAEKALRESEERYRLLVDESPYAIGIHQEGKIVYMNPAAVCLLGAKTADELVGLPIEQIIAHENWEAAQARIERMLQGETGLYPTEDRYLRLDGVVVPVEVTAVPFTHKGKPAIQVIALDISQRKQAEQGLAEALAKWESLVQNAPNFIAILDRDYRLQYVNHIQPGFQREDVIGSSTFAYADPEYHDTIRQKIDHVFHTGEAVRYEILGQGPHGETTWYETWVGPLIMDGAIAFVTLISSEITERKQTEEALQQQQERLEEAEKFAKLGSWDLPVGSSDGWWSKQMFELLGFNPTMGIPDIEDYLAAIHPDDRYLVKNALTMMSQGQEPDSEVYRSNPERGSLRYFRPTVHCQKDAEGNPVKFVGTLLDITERKLADDALQQYTQRLETLRQIDGAILSAQSKEEIAHAALGHVYELIPCRRVAVTEVDLASGLMTILASYQDENSEVEIGKQVSAPNEAFVAQISQGHPVIIDDLLQYTDRPEVAALYEMGIRTYLVIPLIAQGELIGGITFGADKPGAISKADIAVVQQVADHLAIALQQARLVELIQNRLQELITLQQASLTFTRLLSPAKIGQKVIEIIEAELNYKRGAIFTLSETGDSLELLAHSSLGFESHEMRAELSRVRSLVAGGKGISAWVAFHGEVVRSGDIKQDPRYVEADPHINSELCVPLQVGGKTIGSLNVESEKRDAFNEHDERLLMTLAS
ncbi:MAG: PAS domain S-box protein, partial [Chloroflexi bacterium]